jgi:hypothetical protein
VPDDGVENAAKVFVEDAGVVNVVFGKKGVGIDGSVVQNITQLTATTIGFGVKTGVDDNVADGDAFGASVTATRLIYEGVPRPALLIGCTGEDVSAGTLHVMIADPDKGFEVPLVRAVLRGSAGPGGHFGQAAVATEQKIVCASAPAHRGQVTCFDLSQGFDAPSTQTLEQADEGGVEGKELGDDFGWSLAMWNGLLAVGAPGEERARSACNTGVIETFDPHTLAFRARYQATESLGFGSGIAAYVGTSCAVASISASTPELVTP